MIYGDIKINSFLVQILLLHFVRLLHLAIVRQFRSVFFYALRAIFAALFFNKTILLASRYNVEWFENKLRFRSCCRLFAITKHSVRIFMFFFIFLLQNSLLFEQTTHESKQV